MSNTESREKVVMFMKIEFKFLLLFFHAKSSATFYPKIYENIVHRNRSKILVFLVVLIA